MYLFVRPVLQRYEIRNSTSKATLIYRQMVRIS